MSQHPDALISHAGCQSLRMPRVLVKVHLGMVQVEARLLPALVRLLAALMLG